jgi:hypothetical protein
LDIQDVVKIYKWQFNNFSMERGAKKLKEEGGKLELSYIWHRQVENINWTCSVIKESCNDAQGLNLFVVIS